MIGVGCFDFSGVDDECEIEYFLRSALGGSYKQRKSRWRERHFYGSSTHDEDGEARSWRYSNNTYKNNNSGRSWGWRQRLDQEEEEKEEEDEHSSTEVNDLDSSQQSYRQTLGLSSTGPLSLEDVKNA